MRRKNYFNRERLGISSLLKGTVLSAILFLSNVGFSQYCSPSYSATSEQITSFVTTNGSTNINYNPSSYPSGGFENLTGSQSVTIDAGSSCSFNASYTTPWSNTFRIWIDWNNNGVYDSSELEYDFGSSSPTSSGSFNVPISVAPGTYNMRVRAEYGSTSNPGPCTSETWGSAADFSIVVTSPYCSPSYSATSEQITSFVTTNGSTNINYNPSSYPSGGFENLVGVQTVSVPAGTPCNFNTSYTTPWSNTFRIWVDWNNNGVYDSSELEYDFGSTTTTTSGSFTVPGTVTPGTYNMRVRAEYGSSSTPGPCTSETWGSAADFSIEVLPPPSCPMPSNIVFTNLTSTSVTASWTGNGSNFEYAVVPAGSPAPTSGTAVTSSSVNISTGLSAGTGYDFYVLEDCGGSLGTSNWSGPHFFQTAIQYPQGTNCTVGYDSLLFEEEFNSLANWTNSPAEWNTNSGTTGSSNTGPSGAQSGFSYAYVETSGFNNSTTDLTSPLIELSNFGGDAELTFWMHAYGATIGTLDVDIATSQSGPYTTEFTWSGQFQTDETDPWQHIGVDLSSYVGQDIYVRFSYTSGSSFTSDIAIDQVRVNACFDCSYLASFSIGNDTTYCANQGISLPLDAGAADSYTWSTSETTQTITVDTAGQYSVTKNVASCQLMDTIELFSTPFINLDLGPDTSYCADEGINLSLNAQNPTASFMWTDSSTSQFLTVDTAGIYTVTVTDTNGCSTNDGVYVVEHQIPNVVLPADSDYCADQTIAYTLDAGNPLASGYLWQDNSTNQTFTATNAGTYWVEVTDMNGCTNADTIDIIEDPLPVVNLGNDTSYCDSEDFNITLDADNPTADYWWNDGSDDQTLLVNSNGTYWVEVTSTQNCVNSDTLVVIENQSPEVDLGNDTVLSPGYTITLHAGNAGNYLWNDGSTDTTRTVSWGDIPGEFSVQVVSDDGCVNADFIYIDANTGIEEVVKGDIKVYPNPTRDNANIDMNLKESGEMTIEVYSLSGQLLQQQQYGASLGHQIVPVDLSTVESGMYIINLKMNNERIANFNITKM